MKRLLLGLGLALCLVLPANAQRVFPPSGIGSGGVIGCIFNTVPPTLSNGWYGAVNCDNQGKLLVAASVSSSVTGWPTTQTTGTPISVTTGGVTGTLPAGTVVLAANTGATNTAYCKLGASATVSDVPVFPLSTVAFTVGAATQLTCITSSSTTTVNMSGGSGLPTGWGGGSSGGGGGGGGAITAASGSYASGALSTGSMVDFLTTVGSKAAGTAATSAQLIGGVFNSSPPSLSNGQQAALQFDTAGNLKINVVTGGAGGGAVTIASGAVASGAYASGSITVGAIVDGASVAQGAKADSPCTLPATTTTCSQIAIEKAIANAVSGAIPAGTATIGTVGNVPYPLTAVPYTATATGTTTATTATLAGASSVTTYLCGFSIRSNATAAATGNATVTGVITATLNYNHWTAPVASGIGITEQVFAPCIPASGTNQSIAVVSPAAGTGGVTSVTAWGYKL